MPQRKLSRKTDHRNSLLRNLTTSFFKDERIETTEAKAKEIKSIAEKMISLAKKNDLASRRRAAAYIYDEDVVTKLFEEIASRYTDRQGGYTRIFKKGPRNGDGAPMAILELVEEE